eukprot:CAMPEP_0202033536 /NCGR_PEP_ID=MMETSP0905-20130828/66099_1 /ASSEMBLY_ACC=CAM_ASM_000554 /TAXON_ID=420261 /ORGANISM="Thalassiosira antarctica, Strain CCMP982" /LENGTH=274 /DNA_ID=CAMNT_0048597441 /DNA_START=43 /DNA_END=870 /DNA_ORIENTATION=-
MPPRRSGRRSVSAYKKGDYIEYQYKGSTVTGKLFKRSPNGTEAKPIWIVAPSDRRRRNEDIPEKALGKIINAQEAMSNRGPKLKKSNRLTHDSSSPTSVNSSSDGSLEEPQAPKRLTHDSSSPTSVNSSSDGSLEEPQAPKRKSGRGSPSEDNSKAGGSATRKRKSDDSNINSGSEKDNKSQKIVTFSQESNTTTSSKMKIMKKAKTASTRIGTRSTRGSGEAVLLPDLPVRRKNIFKAKKVKKDENVTVVKMLTGTLYLYRGDRPRAEFVRSR